jgi:uncharacterized damage-inducible protein DinB
MFCEEFSDVLSTREMKSEIGESKRIIVMSKTKSLEAGGVMSELQRLISISQNVSAALMRGLRYIPPEKRDWKPAPTTWSAHEIVIHASYTTEHYVAKFIKAEPSALLDETTWRASNAESKDASQIERLVERVHQEFVATVQALSDESLMREVQMPWGQDTVASAIAVTHLHLAYHTGQLNYIQTHLGDRENHYYSEKREKEKK